ncbi:MucR family transcriptional regulator [Streptomyces sp. NPDC057757]|uniref:MucR family transcriptional regulator n=1 Tax=Streptomyces sp. NPDC057757 TaxID=3346241 RepID=UPI00369E9FDA
MTTVPAALATDTGLGVLHPDFGRLVRDESTDTVVCHVCGRAFRALGAHVRAHRMTAAEYRRKFGLLSARALSARSLSAEQSRTRLAAYRASEQAQARFAAGRAMARSGELTRRRWGAATGRTDPEERRRVREVGLGAGRRTQARAADDRMTAALRAHGFTDLGQALRTLYAERENSVEDTARMLSVGRGRLRRLLAQYGIPVRPAGHNSAAGRRSRARLNDLAAAERVGTRDIAAWLRERTAEGATLRELSAATGRSIPWVASRIGAR